MKDKILYVAVRCLMGLVGMINGFQLSLTIAALNKL